MPKTITRDQLQSRKEKAVRFVRDVLGDPDRAEEIADEDLEHYAGRRKITLVNPSIRRKGIMATKRELEEQIRDLEDENQALQDQLDAIADIVTNEDASDDEDDDSADDDDNSDDEEDDAQD